MKVADSTATAIVHAHFTASRDAASAFFERESAAIAVACERMAGRFSRGATLFALGAGAQATDAQHIAVEFVHPIVVGKRALQAIALTSDAAVLSAAAADGAGMFASPLAALGRPHDIVLGLCGARVEPAIAHALGQARTAGLLTLLFSGADDPADAEIRFSVPVADRTIVQEVHETLYHVLWELVHVFLDHDAAPHPFLLGTPAAASPDAVRREVQQSILAKSLDICALRDAVSASLADRIVDAGTALAARVRRGGRVLAFGNGGSATDAQDIAADCLVPPRAEWRVIPSLALTNDAGVVTAVANDIGFDHVYARQVCAFGGPDDVAVGISTSGTSRSVIAGLEAAKGRGMLTIALSGNDGGALAVSPAVDVCLTVSNTYTPRIQEAHATIWHATLAVAQAAMEDA